MSKLLDKFENFENSHLKQKTIQIQDLQPPKPPKEVIE